jgi:DNA-binding transcriptional ArsR family regulator
MPQPKAKQLRARTARTIDHVRLAARFRVVSDRVRVRLLVALAETNLASEDLQTVLGLARPALDYHISHLRAARVIEPHREGWRVLFGLTNEGQEMHRVIVRLLEEVR